MATNVQVSSSSPQRLLEQKRNLNSQKSVAQYNGKSKNESTSNSADVPDQMLKNNQDVEIEQLKNYGSVKEGNILQENNVEKQKRNGTSKSSYLNKEEYAKQRIQKKRNKSLELNRNKEKEDGSWSDKHTELSPVAKSRETKNGKHFVYTACNRETCRLKRAENDLNTEKLTKIINNSIQEAMQSIVKDSPNILNLKQNSQLLSNKGIEPVNKIEKPGHQNINFVKEDRPMSTLNGFDKINYPPVNRNNLNENQRVSRDMNFIKSHATAPSQFVEKCNKITCPYLTEKMEAKPKNVKKSMKSFRMPLKHSTADNRKMTGNVNIYICSEANNEKEIQESRESESVTATETDIKASVSTISSNKLITSLLERRRQLKKSSLQCLCRKSATVLESRIEEIPPEENHPNDVTNLYVPPSLDPASNYVAAINNTNHVHDMKRLEKINRNFDHFDNNNGDQCNVQNCPYLKRRSIGHGDYIKNNYPMNVRWSTENDSIIPNKTINCDCFCTKKNCPYLVRNGSLTSIDRFDQYDVSNNKGKDRCDGKWQDSEIEEVCIYCAPRRDKKVEQYPTRKLNKIWEKCLKARKQKEPFLKNFGTSQRRNCAEQCSISNSIREEIEENNINMNDEDLLEKIDTQKQEVDVSSSYNNREKVSVDKFNVKDEATALSAELKLQKSSVLLSSTNFEEKYQDEPSRKIGSVGRLSEDKDQSQQKHTSNAELVSSNTPSPIMPDKKLDTVTTQEVTPALKNNKKPVIIKKKKLKLPAASAPSSKVQEITEDEEQEKELDDKTEKDLISKENKKKLKNDKKPAIMKKKKLKLPAASAPFSKIQEITENEEQEKELDDKIEKDLISKENKKKLKDDKKPVIVKNDKLKLPAASAPFSKVQKITETEKKKKELDDRTAKDLISKENQKDSIFQRILKRVKELLGFSNVTDNTNVKKRRGCGPSCRALPRNLVKNGDAEDQSPNQPAAPFSTDKSKKEDTDTTEETTLKKESSKNVIISSDKIESHKDVLNINKKHASKVKLRNLIAKKKMLKSNKNKNTTENEEIKIDEEMFEIEEDAQLVSSVTNAKESKSSKGIIGSITDDTESSRIIQEYDSPKSNSQIIKDTTNAVINSEEIESQQNLTNSPRTIISKDSNNFGALEVSSNLKSTEESPNFQESEDPEKFVVTKTENYSVDNVKSTENNESDILEEDDFDGYIQSKETEQIDHVCNCKESEKDFRVRIICCSPEDNCSCKGRNKIKTMICVNPTNNTYRDNFREGCTYQKSVCNCSRYDVTQNNCNCNRDNITDTITCSCNKKNIVSVQDDDNVICVTAWKPAKDNNKYFTRTLEDFKDLPKECRCFDNSKPYGSEELPYQRLGVFSQVMTELQEKMNESIACKKCQNIPCCCAIKEIQTISKEGSGDKTKSFDRPGSQNRTPSSCKCALNTSDSLFWKTSPSEVEDRHKPTSCCCRQSRSAQCRSRAKCFYCKCSPCRCLRSRETSRSRSCRCDNSLYRNGEVSLPKVKDTRSQIFKNFKCPCTTPRNPCSF